MKLDRTDKLPPAEMAQRGSEDYLWRRRRTALVGEVETALGLPRLLPRFKDYSSRSA